MKKNKELPKVSTLESSNFANNLILKSSSLIESNNETDKLAGSIIICAIAEEIVNFIFLHASLGIYNNCVLVSKIPKSKFSNLGAMIQKINVFNFPGKNEIIELLTNIKKDRDSLFHDLFLLPESGSNIDKLSKSLNSKVENLFYSFIKLEKRLIK